MSKSRRLKRQKKRKAVETARANVHGPLRRYSALNQQHGQQEPENVFESECTETTTHTFAGVLKSVFFCIFIRCISHNKSADKKEEVHETTFARVWNVHTIGERHIKEMKNFMNSNMEYGKVTTVDDEKIENQRTLSEEIAALQKKFEDDMSGGDACAPTKTTSSAGQLTLKNSKRSPRHEKGKLRRNSTKVTTLKEEAKATTFAASTKADVSTVTACRLLLEKSKELAKEQKTPRKNTEKQSSDHASLLQKQQNIRPQAKLDTRIKPSGKKSGKSTHQNQKSKTASLLGDSDASTKVDATTMTMTTEPIEPEKPKDLPKQRKRSKNTKRPPNNVELGGNTINSNNNMSLNLQVHVHVGNASTAQDSCVKVVEIGQKGVDEKLEENESGDRVRTEKAHMKINLADASKNEDTTVKKVIKAESVPIPNTTPPETVLEDLEKKEPEPQSEVSTSEEPLNKVDEVKVIQVSRALPPSPSPAIPQTPTMVKSKEEVHSQETPSKACEIVTSGNENSLQESSQKEDEPAPITVDKDEKLTIMTSDDTFSEISSRSFDPDLSKKSARRALVPDLSNMSVTEPAEDDDLQTSKAISPTPPDMLLGISDGEDAKSDILDQKMTEENKDVEQDISTQSSTPSVVEDKVPSPVLTPRQTEPAPAPKKKFTVADLFAKKDAGDTKPPEQQDEMNLGITDALSINDQPWQTVRSKAGRRSSIPAATKNADQMELQEKVTGKDVLPTKTEQLLEGKKMFSVVDLFASKAQDTATKSSKQEQKNTANMDLFSLNDNTQQDKTPPKAGRRSAHSATIEEAHQTSAGSSPSILGQAEQSQTTMKKFTIEGLFSTKEQSSNQMTSPLKLAADTDSLTFTDQSSQKIPLKTGRRSAKTEIPEDEPADEESSMSLSTKQTAEILATKNTFSLNDYSWNKGRLGRRAMMSATPKPNEPTNAKSIDQVLNLLPKKTSSPRGGRSSISAVKEEDDLFSPPKKKFTIDDIFSDKGKSTGDTAKSTPQSIISPSKNTGRNSAFRKDPTIQNESKKLFGVTESFSRNVQGATLQVSDHGVDSKPKHSNVDKELDDVMKEVMKKNELAVKQIQLKDQLKSGGVTTTSVKGTTGEKETSLGMKNEGSNPPSEEISDMVNDILGNDVPGRKVQLRDQAKSTPGISRTKVVTPKKVLTQVEGVKARKATTPVKEAYFNANNQGSDPPSEDLSGIMKDILGDLPSGQTHRKEKVNHGFKGFKPVNNVSSVNGVHSNPPSEKLSDIVDDILIGDDLPRKQAQRKKQGKAPVTALKRVPGLEETSFGMDNRKNDPPSEELSGIVHGILMDDIPRKQIESSIIKSKNQIQNVFPEKTCSPRVGPMYSMSAIGLHEEDELALALKKNVIIDDVDDILSPDMGKPTGHASTSALAKTQSPTISMHSENTELNYADMGFKNEQPIQIREKPKKTFGKRFAKTAKKVFLTPSMPTLLRMGGTLQVYERQRAMASKRMHKARRMNEAADDILFNEYHPRRHAKEQKSIPAIMPTKEASLSLNKEVVGFKPPSEKLSNVVEDLLRDGDLPRKQETSLRVSGHGIDSKPLSGKIKLEDVMGDNLPSKQATERKSMYIDMKSEESSSDKDGEGAATPHRTKISPRKSESLRTLNSFICSLSKDSSESDIAEQFPLRIPEQNIGEAKKGLKGLFKRKVVSLNTNKAARELVKQQQKDLIKNDIDQKINAKDDQIDEKKMHKVTIVAIQKQALCEQSEDRLRLQQERVDLKSKKDWLKKLEKDEEKWHKERKKQMKEREKDIEKERKRMKLEEKTNVTEDQVRTVKQLEAERAVVKKNAKDEVKLNEQRKKEMKKREKELQKEKKRVEKEEKKRLKKQKEDALKNYIARRHNLYF